MKHLTLSFIAVSTAVASFIPQAKAQVEYVDPTIGGVALMLVPTRPLVHMPNSMVRVYPVRKDQLDLKISSFPLSIVSHRHGELFSLMPGDDGSPQVWDQEITTPYYFSTLFVDSGIRTEFTATERAGFYRFTFPEGKATLHLRNILPGALKVEGPTAVSPSATPTTTGASPSLPERSTSPTTPSSSSTAPRSTKMFTTRRKASSGPRIRTENG